MTTFTDKELIKEIKERIGSLDVRDNIEYRAYEITLASLAAESVSVNDDMAYAFHHALSDSSLGADEVEEIKAGLRAAFVNVTTQPAPVVPEFETWFNSQESGRSICSTQIRRSIQEISWNACCAAMLQGSQPVSQTYKSQHTQFEQVADLYEMQFDDGRTCAFHTDAQKAAQWLQACDGNRVQEYVKLERLRNALSGTPPVTPDGWISCSERMPEDTKMLLAFSQGQIVAAYWNWVMSPIDYKKYRAFTYLSGNILDDVTHWMPLPEPPQEMK